MKIRIAKYKAVTFLNDVCTSTKKRNKVVALIIESKKMYCEGCFLEIDSTNECDYLAVSVNISDLRRLRNILLVLEEQLAFLEIIQEEFSAKIKIDITFNAMLI